MKRSSRVKSREIERLRERCWELEIELLRRYVKDMRKFQMIESIEDREQLGLI